MKHKSRYIIENIRSIKDKVYELSIITPLLCDKDLLIVRPYTQFPVRTTDNRKNYIDLYYEDIKLGIEIYEPFHEYQTDTDEYRKKEIEGNLGCQIIEIRINDNFIITEEIAKLKKLILDKISEEKLKSNYNDWEIPFHTLEQVKEDYPNGIFANANNFSSGVHGPIKINSKVVENADLFVVYSGGTAYKVFKITKGSWIQSEDSNLGFLQYGNEIPNHPLLASGATDWNVTTNRVLGKNIQNFTSYRVDSDKKYRDRHKNSYSPKGKFKKVIRNTTRRK
jgi:very-short-patch-repair endonuclease